MASSSFGASDGYTHAPGIAMKRAGKTAPRLLRDLLEYDPKVEQYLKRNTLTSGPSALNTSSSAVPIFPEAPCEHNFVERLEPSDSSPQLDSRPTTNSTYTIQGTCRKCLLHLSAKIQYGSHPAFDYTTFNACPNEAFPVHHFQHTSEDRTPARYYAGSHEDRAAAQPDCLFGFRCSAPNCPARLTIALRSPRISPHYLHLISNQALLQKRLETAVALDPGRGDNEPSTAIANYELLCVFLTHALDRDRERKTIKNGNRRFVKSFGSECDELLQDLGFAVEMESDGPAWALPQPLDQEEPEAFEAYLNDARNEFALLAFQRPPAEMQAYSRIKASPIPLTSPKSIISDISRLFGFSGYDKTPMARRPDVVSEQLSWQVKIRQASPQLDTDVHSAYAILGALHDFSDALVGFAFDRQRYCDPEHVATYSDALSDITTKHRKNSDELELRLAVLKSEGYQSKQDVADAFNYFGFDVSAAEFLDETHVKGVYLNYVSDSAATTHAETREKLRTVARAMRSRMLEDIASNEIETYEQALQYLDADVNTADEMLVNALYPVKVQDNANNSDLAKKAMQLIAEARDSTYLKEWLASGSAAQPSMDIAEACRILQIEDRTSIDVDNLDLMVMTYGADAPDRQAEFERAAEAIKAALNLEAANAVQHPQRRPEDWPVGIRNLGNTCYLNSLLQFYFTVKPFREMLIQFDDGYRMEHDADLIAQKTVGGRRVTVKEVDRAHEFVQQLSHLFAEMIGSAESSVQPTLKLASSTLIRPEAKEALRRRSTIGGIRPAGLGAVDGEIIQGPSLPQTSLVMEPKPLSSEGGDDSASDVTLVGDIHTPESDDDMEIIEANELPEKSAISQEDDAKSIVARTMQPESPTSTQVDADSLDPSLTIIPPDKMDDLQPPSRPPPVPPRNPVNNDKSELLREVEYAAKQQDVTEVIDNVLFQIECAMRPTGQAEDGEQEDLIKDLFYGKLKWTYPEATKERVDDKLEIFNAIIVDVASGSRDIYAALDAQFDIHKVTLNKTKVARYGTLERLPPFLQINVQRVGFDREKNVPFKVENFLRLPETLFMDRYLAGDDRLLKRRQRAWEWKEELRKLEWRREQLSQTPVATAKVPEVLEATWEFVSKLKADKSGSDDDLMDVDPLDVSEELVAELQSRAASVELLLKDLDTRIAALKTSIADQFEGLEQVGYRLHALFIHRGSAGAGHYWIYIRDFKRNAWIKYNDDHVDLETDLDTIFKEDSGSPRATPYFLVYVKRGMEDVLADSLCRQPGEVTTETISAANRSAQLNRQQADVAML